MVPLSMTLNDLDPDFKVTIFFDIEYLRNDTTHEVEPSYTRSIEW